jgi:hypothetical protein
MKLPPLLKHFTALFYLEIGLSGREGHVAQRPF